jgi:hypothetical protein
MVFLFQDCFSFQGFGDHLHNHTFITKLPLLYKVLMIIYTRHFHEIAFSFHGLVIIYTRHFHEIDFSLIFNVWSSFTLGRKNYHEIGCFFSSFGDHLHKTCGQKTMP